MTIVEILTWKKGTFTLDVLPKDVADEYRYYPGKLAQEINVDTQSILMDALRIYDEKMRDGEFPEEECQEDDLSAELPDSGETRPTLSADDLGLADFDQLERKIPGVFKSLDESDPGKIQRREITEAAPELTSAEQEELVSFLGKFSAAADTGAGSAPQGGPAQSVVFFSTDELLKYAVTEVCKQTGIHVFSTNEEQDLEPVIAQFIAKGKQPLLVFDSPPETGMHSTSEKIASLRRQQLGRYPQICVIQLAILRDAPFALHAYQDGVRAVIPRPSREDRKETFIADTIDFLETFQAYLKGYAREQESRLAGKLRSCCTVLRDLKEAPEIARVLLEFVAEMFERSLTLIVRDSELIAEKSVGVKDLKSSGVSPALGFRIPLAEPSLLLKVIKTGSTFYGTADDEILREHLFAAIGAPERSTVLLLPMKNRGKTIFITFADFGSKELAPVDLDLLEIVVSQAELVLENSLYQKRIEKTLGT